MNDLYECLNDIKSENTKRSTETVVKKLDEYMELMEIDSILDFSREDIDIFFKKEYSNKSETTISVAISRIKYILNYFNRGDLITDFTLMYFKKILTLKGDKIFTPSEIYNIIEGVINYQEKALVLLIYMGLYDNNFETIRNIKNDNFVGDKLIIDDGRTIKLNQYELAIFRNCIATETMHRYSLDGTVEATDYELSNSEYLIRTKARKGGATGIVPSATLKKRVDLIGKINSINSLTPVSIKQSKLIYDIVRLEYEQNLGEDINQVALKEYLQEQELRGCIEKLNMTKKKVKFSIIKDLIENKDWFIKES